MDDYGYETRIRRAAKNGKSNGFTLHYDEKGTLPELSFKGICYTFKNKTSAAMFIEAVASILDYKKYNVEYGSYNTNKARKAVKNLVSVQRVNL